MFFHSHQLSRPLKNCNNKQGSAGVNFPATYLLFIQIKVKSGYTVQAIVKPLLESTTDRSTVNDSVRLYLDRKDN